MRLARANVHFIGVGGIGMCGLAELLRDMGARVSGSDMAENANTTRLRGLGVDVRLGHVASNVDGAEVVVYSSAVKPDNVEFREARRQKIPLIPRAEALAEIMRLKRGIAVGGSHGKTTTTSLLASVFMRAGAQPTVVVGGRVEMFNSTAVLGQGEWMLAEADESDGSFSRLSPEIAIVTNVDNDHLDHYGTFERLKEAFHDFAHRIPFYGLAIVCGDDPAARATFADFSKRILFYGFGPENDLILRGSDGRFDVALHGRDLGAFRLRAPGRHHALNAAAALAAGLEAGLSFEACASGLAAFEGVDRRFQRKGSARGAEIYDDYGHHPTEIVATLDAFRERFPDRRLVVAFQPHRYSRTQRCWDQFVGCFARSDKLFLLDIYPAGERAIEGVDSDTLLEAILHPDKERIRAADDRVAVLRSSLQAGDVLVTLGAGDVYKIGQALVDEGA